MKKMVVDNGLLFASVENALLDGYSATIPIKGTSMLPFLVGEKDLVVLKKFDSYRPGDIVLFRSNGSYILHRLLSIDQDGMAHIQGDGVLYKTEIIYSNEIIGRAISILKNGKHKIDPSRQPWRLWRSLGRLRRYPLAIIRRVII